MQYFLVLNVNFCCTSVVQCSVLRFLYQNSALINAICLAHKKLLKINFSKNFIVRVYVDCGYISFSLFRVFYLMDAFWYHIPGVVVCFKQSLMYFIVQFSHLAWVQTDRKSGGLGDLSYPLVSDVTKSISKAYNVLIPDQVCMFHLLNLVWA